MAATVVLRDLRYNEIVPNLFIVPEELHNNSFRLTLRPVSLDVEEISSCVVMALPADSDVATLTVDELYEQSITLCHLADPTEAVEMPLPHALIWTASLGPKGTETTAVEAAVIEEDYDYDSEDESCDCSDCCCEHEHEEESEGDDEEIPSSEVSSSEGDDEEKSGSEESYVYGYTYEDSTGDVVASREETAEEHIARKERFVPAESSSSEGSSEESSEGSSEESGSEGEDEGEYAYEYAYEYQDESESGSESKSGSESGSEYEYESESESESGSESESTEIVVEDGPAIAARVEAERRAAEIARLKENRRAARAATSDAQRHAAREEAATAAAAASAAAAAVERAEKRVQVVNGVRIVDQKAATDDKSKVAGAGSAIAIRYRGDLPSNGKVFDMTGARGQPLRFRIGSGEVIRGLEIGVTGMRAGMRRTIVIPAALAYGAKGAPPRIPPNSPLRFNVECVSVE